MIKTVQLTIILIEFFYGVVFSLCTQLTLRDLFYKKAKCSVLFTVLSGVIFGAAAFAMQIIFGGFDPTLLYFLHTAAAFILTSIVNSPYNAEQKNLYVKEEDESILSYGEDDDADRQILCQQDKESLH